MRAVRAARRGYASLALTLLLLASGAGLMVLKSVVDRIPRQKIPGASIIYIPSGKFLKYATLGYSSLAADLIYLSDFANDVLDSPDADLLFGIGEAGLDYFRMRKPKEMQVRSFEYQAELAKTLGLPLVVHSRDAMPDTLEILRRTAPPLGVMHCFSGDREIAMSVLDLGFHISFAGNLTYRSAVDLQESARYVPLDRLLLETDAPFLAPVPHRGKRCRPEHVVHTYEFCADLKKEPLARFADQLNRNFDALLSASRRLRK